MATPFAAGLAAGAASEVSGMFAGSYLLGSRTTAVGVDFTSQMLVNDFQLSKLDYADLGSSATFGLYGSAFTSGAVDY